MYFRDRCIIIPSLKNNSTLIVTLAHNRLAGVAAKALLCNHDLGYTNQTPTPLTHRRWRARFTDTTPGPGIGHNFPSWSNQPPLY